MKTGLEQKQLNYILKKLSENLNYSDPKFLKTFYIAFCRTIINELKTHGVVRLPELGRFEVRVMKFKKFRIPRTGEIQSVPNSNYIRFLPNVSLEMFFKQLPPMFSNSLREKMKRFKLSLAEAGEVFNSDAL